MNHELKHVLIIDNATTCAMRIKTLVHIHGAKAKVMHWSEWDRSSITEMQNTPCILIIEQTVPFHIVRSVIETLNKVPLFVLFNPNKSMTPWETKKQINPLSSALSNFELMTILEPYWLEDKTLNLPDVIVLDELASSAQQVIKMLSKANISCDWLQNGLVSNVKNVDVILVNITDGQDRFQQITQIKQRFGHIGIIGYGQPNELTSFENIKNITHLRFDEVLDINQLHNNWLPIFHDVWQRHALIKEDKLVVGSIQNSFDKLLEKSLIAEVLMANSMDGIVAFSEDGIIVKFNDGFCELLGVVNEQVKGSSIYQFLSLQSGKELQRLLPSDYLFQQQVLDLHLMHEHSVSIPVSVSVNRINFHGKYVYVLVMRSNVNQQLQKKILVQQNAHLEHKVKDVIRHRERLTEITRKDKRKQNAFVEKFTRFLLDQDNSNYSSVMINKIENLNFVQQIEAGQVATHIESVNLKQIIDNTLLILNGLIVEHELSVKVDVHTSVVVQFTHAHLTKVLFELVHNAITYSLHGTEIRFVLSHLSAQGLELTIIDQGLGIIEHKQARLFDLYEINEPLNNTCCTGLALSKLLVNLNKGEIMVDNHYENNKVVGTEIKILLAIQ